MSSECEINVTSFETTINDLYQLYDACKRGESQAVSEIVYRLKKRNVRFKLIDSDGTTTLHLMCFHGNLGMVKLLVEMYGNVEAKDENQRTPLHLACQQGHIEIVHYLTYEQRCNPQCKDKDGWTPFYLAFFQNHTNIMEYLNTHGQSYYPELENQNDGIIICDTVISKADLSRLSHVISELYQLYKAYKKEDFQLVTEINSHLRGMNIKFELKDYNSTTTLHLMCKFGNLDMVKNLIEMYGNIEARDENGNTPLHVACGSGCIDVIEYLLNQCGCDREARNNIQRTPLFVACLTGQTDTVQYLITGFSCKLDVRNDKGWTLLHIASAMNHDKIARYLINCCGCSPEVRDEIQRTPLHLACLCGRLEMVKYLTSEYGCNTGIRDKFDCTPLDLACNGIALSPFVPLQNSGHKTSDRHVKIEVTNFLIKEQGCDPEAETLYGTSPILHLYCHNELSMIKCCVKLKKHNPKTWRYHLNYSQSLNFRNLIMKQSYPSLYQSQSSTSFVMSPIHLACSGGKMNMDTVKFLVEECGVDPMERSELVGSHNTEEASIIMDTIKYVMQLPFTNNTKLTPSQESAINQMTNGTSNQSTFDKVITPLLIACVSDCLEMLKYLICKCGSTVSSHHYDELKITACKYGYSDIMKHLLKLTTPHTEDLYGNTLLHFAVLGQNLKGAYEIVKLLIASMCSLDKKNCIGETALHTACKMQPCPTNIIELLLSSGCNSQISNFAGKTPLWVTQNLEVLKVFMQYSPTEVCERILSDDMDKEQSLKLLQCLVKQHNWNPNNKTKDGDTALHLACKADKLTTVEYLFSIDAFKYDPYAKNKCNQTPIELTSSNEIIRELIKHGSNPIDLLANPIIDEEQVLQLIKEIDKEKLNGITNNDNTALHLACLTDRAAVVKYLLRESDINVNGINESGIFPIKLTENSEIIRELIRYGANPTDLYSYCRRVLKESKPLQTTVKVFVLGDSNVGKSTLVSSLQKEGRSEDRSSTATTVAVDAGSGVITHDFSSKKYGQITLYDFVGGRLFHESQSELLRKTSCSPRIFLVLTNLSGSGEEIISDLQYWLGFLEEISPSDSKFRNHTIIVGSNMDKCRNDVKRKATVIKSFLREKVTNLSNAYYHDFIALDCRSHSSSDITKLQRCLEKACDLARRPKAIAFIVHCFQVYITDKFKEEIAVSIHEIFDKIKEEDKDVDENDLLSFLPQSYFQLKKLCIELHNKSQVLYLRDSGDSETDVESSWIVIDKAALTSQLFEVFESGSFKQLPSNNGVLPFSTVSEFGPFKAHNPDMFIKFLCHLEYCKEVSDQETFQAITNSAPKRLTSERYFFFPVLIDNNAPEGVWNGDPDNFSYHCGWILQCTKQDQFFTSKFLQILILRVMFCNTYLGPSGANVSILLKCTVWKGGIFWGNIFGAESLVEVLPDNKTIIFLMRCRDANLVKCMEHRSTIIHQIRQCAEEFCGNLKTSESLLSLSLVTKYPIEITPSNLFDIKTLAFAIANVTSIDQPYATSLTGTKTISTRDLLKFEPYIELSALIIQEICNRNNPRYISCLTDHFLIRFAQQIRRNPTFMKIITQILNDHGILDSNIDNLLSKLTEWRDTCHVTYQQLHRHIDQFSIFAGLNIVVCFLIIIDALE